MPKLSSTFLAAAVTLFLFCSVIDGCAPTLLPQRPPENYQGALAESPSVEAGDYWIYQRPDGSRVKAGTLFTKVEFPLWIGRKWTYRSGALPMGQPQTSKAHRAPVDVTCEATAFNPIAVEAGSFDAFECRCECNLVGGSPHYENNCGEWTVWYAPQVKNVVKVKTESTAGMLELTDYNIPGRVAKPVTFHDFYNRALGYGKKGDYDRAIQDYDETLRLNPNYVAALNNRGNAYLDKKEYNRAIEDYDRASGLDPNYALAFYNRARAYSAKKDDERALQDYEMAIRINPKYAAALYNRGNIYRAKKDYDRAIKDYDQAIQLKPDYALAFNNRGNIFRSRGDYDRAIQDYDDAVRLDRNYAAAFRNRGRARFDQGQFATAVPDLAKSAELQPSNLYSALWLYIAETRAGQNGRVGLESRSQWLNLNQWPGPVVDFYLGKIDEKGMYTAMENRDPKKKREQICEANFYAAEAKLLKDAIPEAIPLLRSAEKECPPTFFEAQAARAELKRLGY